MRTFLSVVIWLVCYSSVSVRLHAATIFTNGSNWKYFVGIQEASTPSNAWREITFVDSSWQDAPTPIGYAEPANDAGGYEATIRTTIPSSTAGNYSSVFLRKTFNLADPNAFAQLRFNIVVDDGFILWVNGREVGRFNPPTGQPAFNSFSGPAIEATATVITTNNPGAFLVSGPNVVALQLFNAALNSSDIFLDVLFTGIEPDLVPPTVANVSPAPGNVGTLTQITVTFSEPVTGVDATDLLINNQPAISLTVVNSNTYTFSFNEPAIGTADITWSPSHGIQDLGVTPNPFNANGPGATWQYQTQDRTAPLLLSVTPQPGFTVRSLTDIDVRFSEPVQGVDAGDLRINGAQASTVSTGDGINYRFSFPEPPTGAVQVAWSSTPAISDLGSPPNPFSPGPGWSYILNPNAPVPSVIITEFLAGNSTWKGAGPPPANKMRDEDGEYPDWIEIYNSTEIAVNLNGWHLTDNSNRLTKWTFPETNLAAKAFMVIFASEKDRSIPGRPLHTNFKLSGDGEYLALVRPDGVTLATVFSPTYGPQIDDVSFGFPTLATPSTLISNSSPVTAFVPTDGNLLLDWTFQGFSDSGWIGGANGVGFETATNPTPSLQSFIGADVENQMFGQNSSIFIRIPFVVNDVSKLDVLTLSLRFDDGFVLYLNGQEVARSNAPAGAPIGEPLLFDARASTGGPNNLSTNAQAFDLTSVVRNGGVQSGINILAIHGLNSAPDNGDFLIQAELTGFYRDIQLAQARYFPSPTPGADNGAGTENLGPIVSNVKPTPAIPTDNDDILVTAQVTRTFGPIGPVTLTYRVMYGTEAAIPMLDDGQHGDGLANDGIFGATIPASGLSTPGQMVRWFVRANDTQGRSLREPAFLNATNSPQYFGTIVYLPPTNNLPVLHWFMQNPGGADGDAGSRGSVFFLGEFYDNMYANIHGQSSRGFPKKSYDLDFNPGNNFLYNPNADRVDDINLLTTYPDKAHMRNMLSYGIYHDSGSAYHFVIPVRVQLNALFQGDWHMVENGDVNFLKRIGKDPNGALYKMYNTFTDPVTDVLISSTEAEKKSRKQEGNADLVALMNGVLLGGTARVNYIYDNLNIPQMINYLASRIMTGDVDCCHKNYYFYRDSDGTGEWEGFPWDVDLSFGRVWDSGNTYWNQNLIPTTGLDIGNNNGVFSVLLNGTPQTRQMYLRRIRTLTDELLGSPSAPLNNFESQIDYWLQQLAPDAALDAVKWPFSDTWGNASGTSTCCNQTIEQAAAELKTSYLPQRRAYLYTTLAATLPPSQPTNAFVQIRSIEFSPTNSNQAQEYIELFNTNAYAVDISGWKLSEAVDYTFRGGVVIPPSTSLYVSPDVKAFRARTTGPRGGQGLFVQGNYNGQLSARGENIVLTDKRGRQVTSLAYPGNPSAAQSYLRITELMYHPAPLSGNASDPEEFEYVELKNISTNVTLNLTGVHFTNGIFFDFTGSAVTSLAAGQSVLVVKNPAAFAARYGSGLPVAGLYSGNLDNSGERLRLLDASNEEIMDFSYNNAWYPVTDGLGFSLVIKDEKAVPESWNGKANWRASTGPVGSPGQDDPPVGLFFPVLVNEVLTRTLTVQDSIELFNPNTNSVDISGWFLTDDFNTPKKFRIPDGTTIGDGAYRLYTETDFNSHPGVPPGFALSSDGDEVYLFGALPNGDLTGFFHGFKFDAAEEETAFGRYVTSEGKEQFVRQSVNSPTSTNAGPKVGPIVISEIMYHPPDVGTNDNSIDEYVELLNITTAPVSLFHPGLPTATWKITSGIDFLFPTNVWLNPGEALLVVNFSPTNTALLNAFKTKYGVAAGVQVFGPYSGKLNNDSDSINLRAPTPPVANSIPYPLIDRVEFQDSLYPSQRAADGFGYSLHRRDVSAYGNDPINWFAAPVGAGAPTATNGTPPSFAVQPVDTTLLAGQGGALSPTVNGTGPFTYQWRHEGTNLPGATSLSLPFVNSQFVHAGNYELLVANAFGALFSDTVRIIVRFPVFISQYPTNIETRIPPDPAAAPVTNITFSVGASSIGTVRYQWRRDGTNILNATNSTYSVAAVKTNDLSYFSVVVTDEVSSTQSTNVWLYPLVSPTFIETPAPQSVVVGGLVTFSAQVTGWPPPFTFEWQRAAATLFSTNQDSPASYWSFTAPLTVITQSYRVIVRNRALTSGRATPLAAVVTLADSDADGIPDQWENLYGGNTTILDRLGDPDNDGMLNWQEYQAGTDPTNEFSNLKITSLVSNGLRLQFTAMSNKTYAVQYCPTLTGNNWSLLSRTVARRTNRVDVAIDPIGPTNRFYRVVTPAPQ